MNAVLAVFGFVGAALVLDVLAVIIGADSRDTLTDDHRR